MPTPNPIPNIEPGDALIFSRRGLFDAIIRLKTFSPATHVEVAIGAGKTVASRNGKGVGVYPMDLDGLYAVLRPQPPGAVKRLLAMDAFWNKHNGRPYGFLALFSFVLIDLHDKGEFCSEMATNWYRDGDFECFNKTIASDKVAPSSFLYIHESVMKRVWQAA